ncbi:hypothetical protein EJ04DRAFT_578236 [Polyplosphaeria fusca]|uniref:Uncharacterized protein n=1 Tax=Polyplosphaeria fusca TaxID=682080 RepID=A0A9P4UZL7_9PLEO|nr:hypothetical protein EJ04DRAFT_578236 [Polyplosphaeria fusca]
MPPTANTNPLTPNPSNPSSLPPRYEIRKLGPEHSDWAQAIVIHSNILHSPVWPVLYPTALTARLHAGKKNAPYLIDHQITSGLSYGVFDTQYVFKRPESAATGGALYWDENEEGVQETQGKDAESARLLQQMDFPLVSVALSYDSIDALDMEQLAPLLAVLHRFELAYHILDERDQRDPESWKATARGQVLFRNATSTRREYEGQGIVGGMARWLMREAAGMGFRGIQIECFHDAVRRVWSRAEEPFRGVVVSEFECAEWRNEEGGLEYKPVKQNMSKVYVDLRTGA